MQRPKRILFIDDSAYYDRQILTGIQSYCALNDPWDFCLGNDRIEIKAVPPLLKAIKRWKIDGIIGSVRNDAADKVLRKSGLPVVNVSGFRNLDLPTVRPDDAGVGRMAARHFLQNGMNSFGFVARTERAYTHDRCDGFVSELKKAGFPCKILIERGSDKTDNWMNNAERQEKWLLSLRKPAAVYCIFDMRARDIAWSCRQLNLRIPADIAILGTGNELSASQMCEPLLSSIDLDTARVGYEAAHLLDRLFCGQRAPTQPILVPPRLLIARQSTDVIAINDADVVSAVHFIRSNAHQPITVKDVLREVPVSRKTLELHFLKFLGCTPGEEIARVRLERAKKLLCETTLPVLAAARNSGFTNIDTFTRFFRRKLAVSPALYRRRALLANSRSSRPPGGR